MVISIDNFVFFLPQLRNCITERHGATGMSAIAKKTAIKDKTQKSEKVDGTVNEGAGRKVVARHGNSRQQKKAAATTNNPNNELLVIRI